MSKPKHTPGHWDTSFNIDDQSWYVVAGENRIASIFYQVFPEEEAGNAVLIATAPELKEALKVLLKLCRDCPRLDKTEIAIRHACLVVAKAEGELS